MDSRDHLVSRTKFRKRSQRRSRRIRCVGKGIRGNCGFPKSEILKKSLLPPERAVRADILQRKREAKSALFTGADIELTKFEAQAVTVRIIANLGDRPLEK